MYVLIVQLIMNNEGKIRGNVKASALSSTIPCVNFWPLEKLERAHVFVCRWKTEAILVPCKEVQKANQLEITSFCTKCCVSRSTAYSALRNHPDNFQAGTLACHSNQHQHICWCLLILNLKWPGWYLTFSVWFMKNIWVDKFKIMEKMTFCGK